MPQYYERGSLFRANTGDIYQLIRGFKYKDKFFFNLENTSTGMMRTSELNRYISTHRNEVSIEELEQMYLPLKFTYVGHVRDYMLLPKTAANIKPTQPTPEQQKRTVLDDIYALLDAI